MKDTLNISKSGKLLKSQDYALLLKEGLSLIEKLSHDEWTDYNTHDPGITILELLCYAITELGYKTAYDIKDLLVERDDEAFKDMFQFFTARQILTNNPVTFYDYRKLLIDMDGVKNAWLKIVSDPKPQIWMNCDKSLLIHKDKLTDYPEDNTKEIKIRGLYDVTLELDEDEKYGDLNELFVEKHIKKDKQDFTFLIDMPSWSYFFTNNIGAKEILDIEFKAISADPANRKLYNAKLRIDLADRNFTVNVKVHSSKKHSTERDLIINTTILDPGKTSILKEYLNKLKAALQIVESVYATLHANRNLCEDFNTMNGLETENIGICADIEVQPLADNEKVLAEIYYRIERFVAPFVNFYSFEELTEKEKRTEEIFEGPALKHGFIDDNELKNSEPKKEIMVSDLIRIIMDVEGVLAVKNITLASSYKHIILNPSVEWCLKIKDGLIPRFEREKSVIVLYKENIPYYPLDKVEVEEYLEKFYSLERKQKLSKDELYDFPVPKGKDMSVENYFSIQDDFPLTYGIGNKGIPGLVTGKRKAQAKQLKAYLLFFDQLLANYLSQLYHVKSLFSYSTKVDKTYFYKVLYNLPGNFAFSAGNKVQSVLFNDEQLPLIYHLIKDFVDKNNPNVKPAINLDDYNTFKTEWIDYKKKSGFESPADTHFVKNLAEIVEDPYTFEKRRNCFLDHVAARFGEQFSDYVLLMYSLDSKKAPRELIDDKTALLQEYPVLSSERAKAFNYKDELTIWNSNNVAGLKKRITRLLGIHSYNRMHLYCNGVNSYFKKYLDVAGEFRFNVSDNEGNIILKSEGYTTNQMRQKGIKSLKKFGKEHAYYFKKVSIDNRFYFNIKAANNEIVATSILYQTITARERAVNQSLSLFKDECNIEGFHIVEHLLLRPLTNKDYLMEVCAEKDCDSCPGEMDPYSFRITLILPYWPKRFDNMAFRRFFEKTVRLETPAHIHPKICWVDKPDIIKFEKAYKEWLTEKAKNHPDQNLLSVKTKNLIKIMNDIRSVYPIATLHDCEEGGDDNIVILNQSILGTFKPDKDGID